MTCRGRHAAPGCGGYRHRDVAGFALVLGCLILGSATLISGIVLLAIILSGLPKIMSTRVP